MYLTRLSYNARPSSTALTIVAKLSSVRIMTAASLDDVGAGDAHRHADVRLLERRRVVDAVAGHRRRRARALEHLDQPHLVLRSDAGDDADVVDLLAGLLVAHGRELGAGDRSARECPAGRRSPPPSPRGRR